MCVGSPTAETSSSSQSPPDNEFETHRRITWHQFRHIHSSLLNDLKVPLKIAQEQLGHASISTTLNIYTHVVDASHRAAVEAVEERLFGAVARNGPNSRQGSK